MELSAIKGIGPTRLESLRAVGVCSLRDLLYFLPQRYEDRTHPIPCADAHGGEVLVEKSTEEGTTMAVRFPC